MRDSVYSRQQPPDEEPYPRTNRNDRKGNCGPHHCETNSSNHCRHCGSSPRPGDRPTSDNCGIYCGINKFIKAMTTQNFPPPVVDQQYIWYSY
jgi:hypothetical protein